MSSIMAHLSVRTRRSMALMVIHTKTCLQLQAEVIRNHTMTYNITALLSDNCVKLWSLSPPTVSTQKATRISDFELLATLSDHQQAVNCVRWAKHGLYLASGSDDRLILLYKMKPGIASCVAFGSKQIANKQNWVCFATLKSHTMGNAVRSFAFS